LKTAASTPDPRVQYAVSRRGLPSPVSLRRWAQAALAAKPASMTLGIRIIGTRESAKLNSDYRGKDGPTNVLSFKYEAPPGMRGIIGDLAICAPVVAREARTQRKPLKAHWAHMVVHGVLHLLGYDHQRKRDADVMESLETRILGRLGYPDPYD
jgi:probable rRNA maturation factor